MHKVVIYYYTNRWIPIMFYSYSDAIVLHYEARLSGKELYIFPPGFNPNDFNRPEVIPLIVPKSQPQQSCIVSAS